MRDLRLLLVEDNEDDAILLINELKFAGNFNLLAWRRVDHAAALKEALATQEWDLVLSDFNLPGYSGLEALAHVRQFDEDLPFFLVSGAIGEETAVAALKAGAHDYLLKDRLSRLPLAVLNELTKASQRRALKQTQIDLETAKHAAEEANERKSQLLAYVAHEFKNPLHAIRLHIELFQRSHSSANISDAEVQALTPHQQTLLNNIQLATRQLSDLVHDLLDKAAIEAGKVELKPTPLCLETVIQDVLAILQPSALLKNIQVNLQCVKPLPEIHADAKRLRQILINLLSNAIKFSSKNEVVTLLYDVCDVPDGIQELTHPAMVSIAISDRGKGISPSEMPRLFSDFYKINRSPQRYEEGSGLGLALIKKLIERHHGSIEVISEPNQGSTFIVRLPVQFAPTAPTGQNA